MSPFASWDNEKHEVYSSVAAVPHRGPL